MKNQLTLNEVSYLTHQFLRKLKISHIKQIDTLLEEVGKYGEVHIIVQRGQLKYINKLESFASLSTIGEIKNEETLNEVPSLEDQFLHKLTINHIKHIDEYLNRVGEYGEVHIIVQNGKLRYINSLVSTPINNSEEAVEDQIESAKDIASNSTDTSPVINSFSLSNTLNNIELNLGKPTLSAYLTPILLSNTIIPYITAISGFQEIIYDIKNIKTSEVYIKLISQNSPISVSLDGASDAIQIIQNTITPWRNKHIKELASLLEREKLLDIECKKAEILEKRALAEKSRSEAKKISAEVDKQRVEIERMKLENEKINIELHREKIKLALDVLKYISPKLTEAEKISYVVKLLQPLDILIASDITMSLVDKKINSI